MTTSSLPTLSQESDRKLHELAARHALLLRSIESIIVTVDDVGRITGWNQHCERVLGLAEPMVLGRRLWEVELDWPEERIREAVQASLQGERFLLDDLPCRVRGDQARVLGLTTQPMRDEAEIAGVLVMGADITERRAFEQQMAETERLESIGRLAAGIAHEINTPIQFVGDNLHFFRDSLANLRQAREAARAAVTDQAALAALDRLCEELEVEYLAEELPRAVEQALDGVTRVARIVRAMKELSHPPGRSKAPADLNRALESATIVSRNEWKYSSRLELRLQDDLPPVSCMIEELSQVFLNLVINAAHAVVERYGPDSEEGLIVVSSGLEDGLARVSVEDNGVGMSEEVRAKCLDPFFTTKPVGSGTGQGLALTHAVVVKGHGGSIELETEVGRGTKVTISVPVDAAPEPEEGQDP